MIISSSLGFFSPSPTTKNPPQISPQTSSSQPWFVNTYINLSLSLSFPKPQNLPKNNHVLKPSSTLDYMYVYNIYIYICMYIIYIYTVNFVDQHPSTSIKASALLQNLLLNHDEFLQTPGDFNGILRGIHQEELLDAVLRARQHRTQSGHAARAIAGARAVAGLQLHVEPIAVALEVELLASEHLKM